MRNKAGGGDREDGFAVLTAQYDMLPPGCTVLCAVSGGADSIYLLHRLWTGAEAGGYTLRAAHFDHALRGAESTRDARFVRDWCREKGIPFHLGTGDVSGRAAQLGQGLEETARQMRYAFLAQTADRLGCDRIATAHTANDNAETVLMDLIRGTALQGLTGIQPRRGRLVRPLLTTTRAEIEVWLEAHGIPHVEDSTNADDTYLRNRVRHQLLPLLEEWNPGFLDRMTRTIPRLRADNEALNLLAGEALEALERREGGELCLPAEVLAGAPDSLALRRARLLLGEAAQGDTDCSSAHLEAILRLARSDSPSGEVHLPHGLTARREYDKLLLHPGTPSPALETLPLRPGETPIPGTGWTALAEGTIPPDAVIRPRQTGDEITLPGRPRKSLKKLLIDAKIPLRDRDALPVAADSRGVLAVAGLGPNTAHPYYGAASVSFIKTNMEEG